MQRRPKLQIAGVSEEDYIGRFRGKFSYYAKTLIHMLALRIYRIQVALIDMLQL